MKRIVLGESSKVLPTLPRAFAKLLYIDPPFNTGRVQKRDRIKVARTPDSVDESNDEPSAKSHRKTKSARGVATKDVTRKGFGGATYAVESMHDARTFRDSFDDFCAFLLPRIEAALPCLTKDASLFVHLDAREVHYVKVALDALLGRESFKNEIIWAYDYGGRPKNRWPPKHDTILWYARDPKNYTFHYDAIDRIPYMAPGLVGKEKAARGKVPTDVWWNTIVPTNSKEKTGYPTQKPLAIVERIVRVHSSPGDVVLDCFCGSGTTGEAAAKLDRGFLLVDESRDAVLTAKKRLARFQPDCTGF